MKTFSNQTHCKITTVFIKGHNLWNRNINSFLQSFGGKNDNILAKALEMLICKIPLNKNLKFPYNYVLKKKIPLN